MLPIGLEPILLSELDFESSVSACFTKGAYEAQISTPHRKEECYYVGEDAVLGNRTPKFPLTATIGGTLWIGHLRVELRLRESKSRILPLN